MKTWFLGESGAYTSAFIVFSVEEKGLGSILVIIAAFNMAP